MRKIQKLNREEKLKAAHKGSSFHRNELLKSTQCGCFYCGYIFAPTLINHWTDKNEKGIGQTATCPKCSIDSVIGDFSGFPIDEAFLTNMYRFWFTN